MQLHLDKSIQGLGLLPAQIKPFVTATSSYVRITEISGDVSYKAFCPTVAEPNVDADARGAARCAYSSYLTPSIIAVVGSGWEGVHAALALVDAEVVSRHCCVSQG